MVVHALVASYDKIRKMWNFEDCKFAVQRGTINSSVGRFFIMEPFT